MSTRGNVVPLKQPRASTRYGPKEARTLANRAHAAGLLPRGAAPRLLEQLLRVLDRRPGMTRQLPYRTQVDSRVVGLEDELGVSRRALVRAVHALEESGLVIVVRGTGRTWSRFSLNDALVHELLGDPSDSTWGNPAVHRGESATPQGCQNDTPGVPLRHPRGATTTPPYAGAREEDSRKTLPPTPAGTTSTGSTADLSPPASGQGPLSSFEKCEHGRTAAQGGCRECHTTKRDQSRQREAEACEAANRKRLKDQKAAREAAAASKSSSSPMPREVREALRKALPDTPTTEEP